MPRKRPQPRDIETGLRDEWSTYLERYMAAFTEAPEPAELRRREMIVTTVSLLLAVSMFYHHFVGK